MTRKDKNILATVVLLSVTLIAYMAMVAQSVCPHRLGDVVYDIDTNREINVNIMTTVSESVPVVFRAETTGLKLHTGEYRTVNFSLENTSDSPITVRVLTNCTPTVFNNYFEQTDSFCFSKEQLKAREVKTIPARFVINPALPKGYEAGGVDISYTVVGA